MCSGHVALNIKMFDGHISLDIDPLNKNMVLFLDDCSEDDLVRIGTFLGVVE